MDDLVTCTKCGEQKFRSEFYLNPHKKNGLFGSCKPCCKSRGKELYKRRRQSTKPKLGRPVAATKRDNPGNPSYRWWDRLPFWPADLDLRDPRKLKSREG